MPKQNGSPGNQKPTARDFDTEAVQRAVLFDTAQHLASLGGWATAALAGVAAGVGAVPIVGWAICGAGVLLALGSWTWNFCFRNKTFSEKHVKKLLAKRREFDLQLVKALKADFTEKGFERGLKEAAELWTSYEALVRLMDDQAGYDDPEATQYRNLADTLYEAGCFNLRKASELWLTLESIDLGQLEKERGEIERDKRKATGSSAEQISRSLATVNKRIADHEEINTRYLRRLADADEIEGTLIREAGNLSDLGVGSASQSIDWQAAAHELNEKVRNAVEADAELKELVAKNY